MFWPSGLALKQVFLMEDLASSDLIIKGEILGTAQRRSLLEDDIEAAMK